MILPRADLPVIAECDVVVAGASLSGCAAALTLLKSGQRVTVVEPRTYPGRELAATLRPWLPADAVANPSPVLAPWIAEAAGPVGPDATVPLHPDRMKRGLEDVLLAAGADLIYQCQPIGVVRDTHGLAGIVIGNKSGRQAILARAVVDASGDPALPLALGLPGEDMLPFPGIVTARRVIEISDAGDVPAGPLPVPAELGIAGDRVTIRYGFLGAGHLLVEHAMALPCVAPDWSSRMAMEIEARRRSFALAAWMFANVFPAAAKAWLAGGSWELLLPPLRRFTVPPSMPNLAILDALDPLTAIRSGETIAISTSRPRPEPAGGRAWFGPAVPASAAPPYTVGEPDVPARGRTFRTVEAPAQEIPAPPPTEVLVAGGGTSGATAGAVAASAGARTLVLEFQSGLGGSGTIGGVDSYWYGRRVGFTAEVDRRYGALADLIRAPRTGQWNIEAKMQALLDWHRDAGAVTSFRTAITGALLEGRNVRGVLAATPDGPVAQQAGVTVDASGDGDVAAFAGAECWYGSGRDRLPMWYALPPLMKPGRPMNNFTSTVDITDARDATRALLAGRRRWDGLDHMTYLAPRETRHIRGAVTLTLTDQLLLRSFPDTVNVCFSNCDIKGRSAADWVAFGVLPPNCEMEIPWRALVPREVDGVIVAGKAYSATHDYLAAARMQADLQNQGGACALGAVAAVRAGVAPRAVDIPALQRRLVDAGVLPAGIPPRDAAGMDRGSLGSLIAGLDGDEPFWVEQGFTDRITEPFAVVRIGAADPADAVPLLRAAYAAAPPGPRRLLLARLLAWHGATDGIPDLVAAIASLLADGTLPPRTRTVGYAGVPPDHGIMPEPCYLLYTLGFAPDDRCLPALHRVLDLLAPALDDFRDRFKGTFYYVDAIAHVAERLATPGAAAVLRRLRAEQPLLRDRTAREPQPDFILERLAYLELAIARALARCGAAEGYRILAGYLDDARAILAGHALDELRELSGQATGRDAAAWTAWLDAPGRTLPPVPWRRRLD